MKIARTIEYAAAPELVFEMVTDQVFQERKCAATGALSYSAHVDLGGPAPVVRTTRHMRTDNFPDFIKTMLGGQLAISEQYVWSPHAPTGGWRAVLTVTVGVNIPVSLEGSVMLVGGGPGSTMDIVGDLRARIPLVGGKVERAAMPAIESAIRYEQETGIQWLGG